MSNVDRRIALIIICCLLGPGVCSKSRGVSMTFVCELKDQRAILRCDEKPDHTISFKNASINKKVSYYSHSSIYLII